MRFGLDYHRYFVPEWSGFYVQYDLIKSQLKSRAKTIDHSIQLLSHDVEAFTSFHSNQLAVLHRRETALWNIFDEPRYSPVFHPRERSFLLSELNAILQVLLKLQWYDRVNQEAIDRLLKKSHAASQSESTHLVLGPLESRWYQQKQTQQLELCKTRKRLQSSISRIDENTDVNANGITDSSPLNSAMRMSADIPSFQYSVFKALNGNGPDVAKDLFTQLEASPEALSFDIGYYLFVFFVVRRSWQNVIMLLEHIASRGSLHFGYNQVQLLITVYVQDTHSVEEDSFATAGSYPDASGASSALDVFARILQLLGPEGLKELCTKDADGTPLLHLLAKHGLLEWCRLALGKIQEAKEKLKISETILSADRLKLTPMHYALVHQHNDVVDFFSKMLVEDKNEYKASDCQDILGSYLSLAVEFGKNEIVAQISRLTHLDRKSIYGSSALHVAARNGNVDIIALLLQSGASINVTEHPRGWTPLFEAAVNGWVGAVQHLIEHGADTAITDSTGWTAKELATYRGHLAVAELLHSSGHNEHAPSTEHAFRPAKPIAYHGGTEPEDIIVNVNLGPMQVGRDPPPIKLKYFSSGSAGANESLYHLNISAAGQTHRVWLPILDDRSNVPLIFVFPKGTELQLAFKIFRDDDPGEAKDGVLVCGGTALLESNKLLFGAARQSLVREHTVSLLDSTTLDIVGSILFTYVIAKPFAHLQSPKYSLDELENAGSPATLIGHRGLGQNVVSREHLQIGENTVESFIAAANSGASFVELDVQVTRDLEPIVYHNFSLSETGTDVPINDITIDQYRYASSAQASQPILDDDSEGDGGDSRYAKSRPRSLSVGCSGDPATSRVRDRLKHTVDFKSKGMKSNTRGHVIQQPLATLKDLFRKLPKTVGFNIEIKYPRFHETVAADVAPIGPELNLCVDTILKHVHLYGGGRPIILSSFTPEICILLSLKQKAYPVMFITNAGKLPMIDVERRAASMQIAVQFAKLWNLAGIVFASEPLVLCPRLIRHVKSLGLVCASYGTQNSIPDHAIAQVRAGIDVLIVDRVGLIAKKLKELTH
ncbi:Glycerophosphoryl diester phosphodiesterase family-domain-containing protein [Xylaria sp. FL1042]|nr:Glycerophosphoryl diester phosphodiesterase family-domain-containing protein [Xylaria sp. FL1042]